MINGKVAGHILAYTLSIVITAWSDQSPRVLLYAHGISVLYKLLAVWLFASWVAEKGDKGSLGKRFTREPETWERSRPWQGNRARRPAGILNYIVVVFTLLFMVGVVLRMGSGPGFLSREVLVPELGWALFIAFIYLLDDLANKQLVVSAKKPVPINLGYNVSGLNFLMAAIFISAFLLLIVMNIAVALFDSEAYFIVVEWLVFLALSTTRLVYDILGERKKSRRLP